jgi:phenylalanyl-tRNA synthetase beta chain
MGCWEVLTTVLISRRECFEAMNLVDDESCVVLANPKAESFQVARKSLLPGILKSMASNKALPSSIGQRYSDVSDVVLLDDTTDTGARNERHLAAAYCGPTAGFEIIQGVMERVMSLLEVPRRWKSASAATASGAVPLGASDEEIKAALTISGRGGFSYRVDEASHPSFFPGRCGRIVLIRDALPADNAAAASAAGATPAEPAAPVETDIGVFGMIHPDVLGNFDVDLPSSAVEINIAPFLEQK